MRGVTEVADHLVDVVLEDLDLALRLDRDRPREVSLSDGGRDILNRADLGREVRRELVHIVREILPDAGHVFHLGLTAELALGTDLARHAGDLRGEGV